MIRDPQNSQNFFQNGIILNELIEKSKIDENDIVIDIGAGHGTITKALCQKCKKVIAVEKDKFIFEKISRTLKRYSNLEIINQDILQFDFPKEENYKIFSNIPFNHTSDIVKILINQQNKPKDIFLFAQKEAALQYLGDPRENLKSLLVKTYFSPKITYYFNKLDFHPTPRVTVILLNLKKREKPLIEEKDIEEWKDFIIYILNKSQPNLLKTTRKFFTKGKLNELSKKFKINFSLKPNMLDFQQWLALYEEFRKSTKEEFKKKIVGEFKKLEREQSKLIKNYKTMLKS
jgi:23S rRNA (adenine-N6)-dimethyltransferase